MASVLAIISKAAFGKLRTYDGGTPAVGQKIDIDRYDSTHPVLDAMKEKGALFLVTVAPGETLWLVAVLGAPSRSKGSWISKINLCPVVDLTPLCAELGLERGDGKLAMRLQTPRVLDQRVVEILTYVETQAGLAFARRKPYAVKVPKRILELPAIPAPKRAPKPKPVAGGKLPALVGSLGKACLAQLDEVFDELREKPERFLQRGKGKRGPFTKTVQSIYAGTVDAAEAKRMLDTELHEWVDDKTRAALKKSKADLDGYFGELVDAVAIRAIDDLCRGIVGYALDRIDAIPKACRWYLDPLQKYGEYLRSRLGLTAKTAKAPSGKKSESARTAKLKKTLAKGAFAFVNGRTLDGDAILAETPIHQAQFIEAMVMYSGDRGKTAKATLDAYLKKEGIGSPADYCVELWDVIEGGRTKPRFEYWVQGAGDGMVFNYGTANSPSLIGSTQHSFQSHGGDDDETLALVAALQAAADRTKGL
jgi:hypothetical protein